MKSRETLDSVMWVYIISRRHNLALEAGACGKEGYTWGVVVSLNLESLLIAMNVKGLMSVHTHFTHLFSKPSENYNNNSA